MAAEYGMEVFNADGELIFNSNMSTIGLVEAQTITIASGGTYLLSYPSEADNNLYVSLLPHITSPITHTYANVSGTDITIGVSATYTGGSVTLDVYVFKKSFTNLNYGLLTKSKDGADSLNISGKHYILGGPYTPQANPLPGAGTASLYTIIASNYFDVISDSIPIPLIPSNCGIVAVEHISGGYRYYITSNSVLQCPGNINGIGVVCKDKYSLQEVKFTAACRAYIHSNTPVPQDYGISTFNASGTNTFNSNYGTGINAKYGSKSMSHAWVDTNTSSPNMYSEVIALGKLDIVFKAIPNKQFYDFGIYSMAILAIDINAVRISTTPSGYYIHTSMPNVSFASYDYYTSDSTYISNGYYARTFDLQFNQYSHKCAWGYLDSRATSLLYRATPQYYTTVSSYTATANYTNIPVSSTVFATVLPI